MPLFASNPLHPSPLNRTLRRHPALFGIPFVLLIVGASFCLQGFAQTRYDLHDQRVSAITKQEELGLNKNRKKFDIREEYFRLSALEDRDWEQRRIPRPNNLPEWEVPPQPTSKDNSNP